MKASFGYLVLGACSRVRMHGQHSVPPLVSWLGQEMGLPAEKPKQSSHSASKRLWSLRSPTPGMQAVDDLASVPWLAIARAARQGYKE
eukprot:1775947-Amphidinium_carterae.1